MQDGETITINSKRKLVTIYISRILYVIMQRQYAEIHVYGNRKYVTRMTFGELKKQLGENFIEVRRGCIVPSSDFAYTSLALSVCSHRSSPAFSHG